MQEKRAIVTEDTPGVRVTSCKSGACGCRGADKRASEQRTLTDDRQITKLQDAVDAQFKK